MNHIIHIVRHTQALQDNYILLLTSNSEEKKAVNAFLLNRRSADVAQSTTGCSLGILGGRFALHVTGESGVSKDRSIARIANALLRNQSLPRPVLTVLVGFCWGNLNQVDRDTSIICKEILALNERHADGEQEIQRLRRLTSRVTLSNAVVQEIEGSRSDELKVRVGPLASLETLYKSYVLREKLVAQYPELLGGEMEGFGFLGNDSSWLVVKAVADSGGDDFTREKQGDAARRAMAVLEPLLVSLQQHNVIGASQSGDETAHLHELLGGDVIEFHLSDLAGRTLTDVLEFDIGQRVEYKLRQYVSEAEYDADFVRQLLASILEILQNAMRYGKANLATLTFGATKVVIEDDGDLYDIRSLKDGRGGALAIQTLIKLSEDSGAMSLAIGQSTKLKGNKYSFNFVRAASALRDARQKCALKVNQSSIGAPYGRPQVFAFDPLCRTVYLDGTRVRMMSRHFELAAALRPLIKEGRKVYVGCRSEGDVRIYREELKDLACENLVLFVDAALPPEAGVQP